jgi:hypothetical protein
MSNVPKYRSLTGLDSNIFMKSFISRAEGHTNSASDPVFYSPNDSSIGNGLHQRHMIVVDSNKKDVEPTVPIEVINPVAQIEQQAEARLLNATSNGSTSMKSVPKRARKTTGIKKARKTTSKVNDILS